MYALLSERLAHLVKNIAHFGRVILLIQYTIWLQIFEYVWCVSP